MKGLLCITSILLFGTTALGQSLFELQESINKLVYKQHEKHLLGNLYGKHRVEINGEQLLIEKDSVSFSFLAKDVVRMYLLREGPYTLITFYAHNDKPFVARQGGDSLAKIDIAVFDVPHVKALLICFQKVFEKMGVKINQESTPMFESDRQANAMHIDALRTDEIYKTLVHGVDTSLTGTYEVCYPNGNVRCYRRLKDGICHGAQRDFYENGQLRWSGYYENGQKNGGFTYHLPGGKSIGIAYYRKGWKFGSHEWRFENGITYSAFFIEKGILDYEKLCHNGKVLIYNTHRSNNNK